MASIFCPECGAKNSYTLKKPNFCQSCGETFAAFGMASASVSKPSLAATNGRNSEDSIPNISKLEYDIDLPKSKVTLETLVNNPLNPDELSYNTEANENFKKMTIEEFTKISQSECGSSRGRSEEVGGGGDG
tara:strand:+ start:194 stop:589 length:396 start_codon:yes stop_codon:yes gene_type:complete